MEPFSPDHIRIRRAGPEDSLSLSQMGKRAYRQHFTYLWTPERLNFYLEQAYAPEVFQQALADDNAIIWLVVYQQELCGYLLYYRRRNLPGHPGAGGYINRIYLLAHCKSLGIGGRLLTLAFEQARKDQRSYIWLESMQSSDRSIRFYRKHGFENVGATAFTQFPLREPELAKMWWMVKRL